MTRVLQAATLMIFIGCCLLTGQIIGSCAHTANLSVCTASQSLIGTVDAALGTDEYEDKLSQVSAALCAVESAVKSVVALAGQKAANKAAVDPQAVLKYERGTRWLEKHGPAEKKGLPGGGHQCCWRPGTWTTTCAPFVQLTPQNLFSRCGCAPVQLWC